MNYDEKEKRRWRECYLVEIEDQVQFTNLIIKKLYKGIGVNVSSTYSMHAYINIHWVQVARS